MQNTSLRLAKHVRTTRIKSAKDPYSLSVHSLQRYIEIHVHKSIQKTDTFIHMYRMRDNNEEEKENANASRPVPMEYKRKKSGWKNVPRIW